MPTPAYTTQVLLERRFTKERVAQLFSIQQDDGSSTGVVDAATLDACIADASAEFDSILGPVFPMPLSQVGGVWDPVIVEIVSIFTMYRGGSLRPEFTSVVGQATKVRPYADEYKDALARCKEIKSGQRRLAGNAPPPKNQGGEVIVNNPSPNADPMYFWPNSDGTGGASGF